MRSVWEILKVILIALAIVMPLRYFVVQPFFVKGASMEPNFFDGEYLIINEISYYFREPRRGEVVVFKFPNDPSQYYIKRVIGLPGEKIKIQAQNVLIGNNNKMEELNEDYLINKAFIGGNFELELGSDEFFVLGDNRRASYDSRQWGAVPGKNMVGRVLVRVWPFSNFKVFSGE